MRDHVRLTIQPFDTPPDQSGIEQLIEQIGSDRMLLLSSDYPHWQFDGDSPIPAGLAEEHRRAHVRRQSARNVPALATRQT